MIIFCSSTIQGCHIFLVQHTKTGKKHQIATKFAKLPQNVPNYHKMFQITTKCSKLPQNIPTSYIARHSNIYPKWEFGLKNIPYGNPGTIAKI
jgi:hypothetical protein